MNILQKIKSVFQAVADEINAETIALEKEMKELEQNQAYITLNNLYLELERGAIQMNLHFHNALRVLVCQTYNRDDFMIDWWHGEFQKLDGWLDY